MKIQPLNLEFTQKRRLKPNYDTSHPMGMQNNNVGLCDKNNDRGYNVSFSGSAPKESEAAAKTFMERIMKSGAFNWLTGFSGLHNVAAAALVALFLAGGLRPAITISLPGKKDLEDKIYAAGHSLASALIGFGVSTLVTTPIDSGAKYIYDDARKISRADYEKLSEKEIAEYISKNNLRAEDIAEKMATDKLSKEEILNSLKEEDGSFFKSNKLAKYVKENNLEIMPIRKFENALKIVSNKTDKIYQLKHQLSETTDMVKRGKILGEIRDLDNWIKAIDTSTKNVSEWVIAIPRAMLTIALIPPILKYVFHVDSGKNKKAPEVKAETPQQETNFSALQTQAKTIKEFIGGKNNASN